MVPAFPPKKIFTLTPAEVEQRREQLEKYMQAGVFFMGNRPFSVNTACVVTSVMSESHTQLRLRLLLSGFELSSLTVYVVFKREAATAFQKGYRPQQSV